MPIPLAITQVVAVAAEAAFYGGYTILFFATLIFLARRRNASQHARGNPILLLTLVMYFLSLTHMILVLYATIAPLVVQTSGKVLQTQGSATIVLAQVVVEVVNYTIADMILIWRVWIVWGRRYSVAALPALVLIAEFVTAILAANQIRSLPGGSSSSSYHIVSLVPITAIMTLVTNVICTTLIAGRILYLMRTTRIPVEGERERMRDGPLIGALLLVLESGFIYSAAWLVYLVLSVADPQAWPIISNIIAQLTGIIPTVIMVLAYLDVFGTVRGQTQQLSSIRFNARRAEPKTGQDTSVITTLDPRMVAIDTLQTRDEGNAYELDFREQDGRDGISETSSGARKENRVV